MGVRARPDLISFLPKIGPLPTLWWEKTYENQPILRFPDANVIRFFAETGSI